MRTLNVYKVAEKFPDNGSEIGFIIENMYGVELRHGVVEYTYLEMDQNGDFTGNQVEFDPSYLPPDIARLKLVALVNGMELSPNDEYFYNKDLFCEL